MDIVKAFNSNDLHTEIIIKGTVNDPLFRASDIGAQKFQNWVCDVIKEIRVIDYKC
jgi:hypothetical protein